MIVAKLNGGLGNQIFQYAAARSLSIRHRTSLKLDIEYLRSNDQKITKRQYCLDNFNITAEIANPIEVAEISGIRPTLIANLSVRLRNIFGLSKFTPNPVRETGFPFDPALLDSPDQSYLVGYWQSEKYFSNISGILRNELSFKKQPTAKNLAIANKMATENAVFLHIRRGDYVSHPDVAKLNGTCDQAYYEHALAIVADKVDAPVLYVFSDEPEWVRQNMRFPFPATVIDHNGQDEAHEDLRLMSLCKHAIIANSTFSWWGAWLIDSQDKVVVAPRKWFADPDIDTSDVIPDRWLLA